ncbi:hypothetical protein F7725_004859 [Dissostichus mawsoni]|uniref:Uncharacterized protein n=1 Tax=Dissostichus mawsoni TaxID=36200 RepID=A0A7J5XJZ4_DISMA|nr:hypothetical protein F7725_004859 [Dissostichus mawsoni]
MPCVSRVTEETAMGAGTIVGITAAVVIVALVSFLLCWFLKQLAPESLELKETQMLTRRHPQRMDIFFSPLKPMDQIIKRLSLVSSHEVKLKTREENNREQRKTTTPKLSPT